MAAEVAHKNESGGRPHEPAVFHPATREVSMRKVMGHLVKVVIALAFVVALTFGLSQTVAAASVFCDTPMGVCDNNGDCFDACLEYNGTEFGGECIGEPGGCCMCLE
jgi:hypothetical protein